MAGAKLAKWLKESEGHEQDFSDILYGKVVSTSPLQVEVEGRFKIGKEHLVLSKTVQDLTINFEVPTYSANYTEVDDTDVVSGLRRGSETVAIRVFRDLRVGDKVSMIRGKKGQLFYILDRRN